MKKIENGAFYKFPEYLLIYSKIKKPPHVGHAAASLAQAKSMANYFSQRLKCEVRIIHPNEIFYTIKQKKIGTQILVFCLIPDFSGWIMMDEWMVFEKIDMTK